MARARPAGHSRRGLRFAFFVAVSSLLLLEVVLQAGSVLVWLLHPAPAPASPSDRTVLCVGDSWTHGIGASDPLTGSYPAQLQGLLRERSSEPWSVVNCGQAGQNSREVLARLPAQLSEFKPRIVCILVGQNDYWSTPELLPESEVSLDHRAYRFRWRLPRLWAWVAGKVTGAGQAGDGRRSTQRAGEGWQKRAFPVERPYARAEKPPWPANPAARALKDEGWRFDATKDGERALRCFTEALALVPDDCQSMQMVASLSRRTGRIDRATDLLDRLRARHQESPGYWTSECLLQALLGCEQWQEVLDRVGPVLERYPADPNFWQARARAEFFVGRHEAAARSIEEAIRLGPDPWHWFWRYKIWFLGHRDNAEALRSMFAGYVVFNDADFLEQMLLAMLDGPAALATARETLRTFACDAAVRQRLEQILADVAERNASDAATEVLVRHLARMVAACRATGAIPVLTCYPFVQKAESPLRRTATAQHAAFVEMAQEVKARLGARSWQELRAPDGHCNDAGYRMMAEIMAEALLPLLGAQRK